MTLLRSLMAAREEHQSRLRSFQNGETVTFDRDQWLYMLNHGQANRDECEVLYQDAETIRVRTKANREPYDPNSKVRTMRFNPQTGRIECVAVRTMAESIARDRARRKTRLSVSK